MSGLIFNHDNGNSLPGALGISDSKAGEIVNFIKESIITRGKSSMVIEDIINEYGTESAEMSFALFTAGKMIAEFEDKQKSVFQALFGSMLSSGKLPDDMPPELKELINNLKQKIEDISLNSSNDDDNDGCFNDEDWEE